jgi:hypothetical protein
VAVKPLAGDLWRYGQGWRERCRNEFRIKALQTAICLSAMANYNNVNGRHLVIYIVDETVIASANPVKAGMLGKLLDPFWAGV